jgi:plastocyanin
MSKLSAFKILLLIFLITLLSCGGEKEDFEITITNNGYSPDELTIEGGSEVTWVNKDNKTHTVTSGVPELITFDSGEIKPNEEFTFEFIKQSIGVHVYYCKIHGNQEMEGTIVVQPEGYKE